jgi:hypothetical protein
LLVNPYPVGNKRLVEEMKLIVQGQTSLFSSFTKARFVDWIHFPSPQAVHL